VVVGPARVEVRAGLVPGERRAAQLLLRGSFVGKHGLLFDRLHELGGREVKDLDALLSSDDQPVELLREEDAVNRGLAVDLSEPLALDEVPDHDESVAGAGSEVGRAENHVESVDLSLVADEGVHQSHVRVVPNLDGLVP